MFMGMLGYKKHTQRIWFGVKKVTFCIIPCRVSIIHLLSSEFIFVCVCVCVCARFVLVSLLCVELY